jgi:predicted nicotinamide N-methyase
VVANIAFIQSYSSNNSAHISLSLLATLVQALTLTMSEFGDDAQRSYERGNDLFKAGDFDAASAMYAGGARVCMEGELLTKLLLNKALCDLKLRLHDSVIRDCSRVLQYDANNVKALLRRASAYEYASEYRKGLADVEAVLAMPDAAPSLRSTASDLSNRLNLLRRQDDRLQRSNTKQPDYLVTNSEQCLRLGILDSDCVDGAGSAPGCLSVNVLRARGKIKFRVCIGNEFGLWNQKWAHCRLCDGDGERDGPVCAHMPSVRCEATTLLDGSHGRIGSVSQVNSVGTGAISSSSAVARFDAHGKADIRMQVQLDPGMEAGGGAFAVVMFRFEVVSPHPDALNGCMNNIIPVLSLPVELRTADRVGEHQGGCFPAERSRWLGIGSRVHAQSIREVKMQPLRLAQVQDAAATGGSVVAATVTACGVESVPPVYVLESPGYLGIGGKVWDSSYVLLAYLLAGEEQRSLIRGRRVLELGSGTGVTGLALGTLRPAALMLSDLAEVVPLLEDNVDLNMLMQARGGNADCPVNPFVSLALPWGLPLDEVAAGGVVSPEDLRAVQTIVASDVVYDPTCYQPLVDTLHHLLLQPTTGAGRICVLAHRHRHPEDHKFFDMLAASADLSMCQIPYEHTAEHGGTVLKDVKIFHIGKK